jgi:two-component system osmolarity sensor histidine kinase EnvZ
VTALRSPTLFVRLFRAQIICALALLFVFVSAFYVERNRTVARLMAERWAPALRAATGVPAAGAAPPMAGAMPVTVARELPADARRVTGWAPRIGVLKATLRDQGLVVEDVAFSNRREHPTAWVATVAADGTRRWLGFEDAMVEPHALGRMLVTIALGIAISALVSWIMARRVARPLETLRRRIAAHDGGVAGRPAAGRGDTRPSTTMPSTIEIDAIDSAFSALRERIDGQESERALLLAGVSHDLRSPLARVRMAAELLPETPGVAERRASIVRNVDVADRLIESFLDYVRAIELPLDARVDLVALAGALLHTRGEPADVLALDAPAALHVARTNALLLERLLGNLVDNALRHGRPPVRIRLHREGDDAVIDVEDHGPGIPPAARAQVTQAFARGDASRGTPGTGLGLAVVQQIVRRMGGTLSFDPVGETQRVRVCLPAGGRS